MFVVSSAFEETERCIRRRLESLTARLLEPTTGVCDRVIVGHNTEVVDGRDLAGARRDVNYQHLLYFRHVAVLGGVTAAAQRLRLTPPTLSAQIRQLEDFLGTPLFERTTRGMSLTEAGRTALRYADRIFALGAELEDSLRGQRIREIRVGVNAALAAPTVRPLLARLTEFADGERVICTIGSHDELLTSLAALELSLVLTSVASLPREGDLRSRLVMESELAFFANEKLASSLRGGFPTAIHGASFVATSGTSFREPLERWLAQNAVKLATNIELADASLAAALAGDGVGIIAAPVSAAEEMLRFYGLSVIGRVDGVHAQIHAVGTPATLELLLPALLEKAQAIEDDRAAS